VIRAPDVDTQSSGAKAHDQVDIARVRVADARAKVVGVLKRVEAARFTGEDVR
jgi:hypothetical protein